MEIVVKNRLKMVRKKYKFLLKIKILVKTNNFENTVKIWKK